MEGYGGPDGPVYEDEPDGPVYENAQTGSSELAFQLFWAWTGHPDEAFARKAWETCDPMSRASWERVAKRGVDYLNGVGHAD